MTISMHFSLTFQSLRLEACVREVGVVWDLEGDDERLREGGQHRLQDRLAHSLHGRMMVLKDQYAYYCRVQTYMKGQYIQQEEVSNR